MGRMRLLRRVWLLAMTGEPGVKRRAKWGGDKVVVVWWGMGYSLRGVVMGTVF